MPQPILQFGTGRFLLAHVDCFVSQALERGPARQALGGIAVVQSTDQPASSRRLAALARGEPYPVRIRGLQDGRTVDTIESCRAVQRAWKAGRDWAQIVQAMVEEVRVVVSNTAEAGYTLDPSDRADILDTPDQAPRSFPARLLVLLFRRWQAAPQDPISLLPCELIERNGDVLRDTVLRLAQSWVLPLPFQQWLRGHCVWASSLVDRIVSQALEPVGAVAEPYALWAVEDAPGLVLPCVHEAVVRTDDLAYYARLKLFILNGGHTLLAAGWLRERAAGRGSAKLTVREAMDEPQHRTALESAWDEDILPVFEALGQRQVAQAYRDEVRERLCNPFLDHRLSDIAQHHALKLQRRLAPIVALAARVAPGQPMRHLRAALSDPIAEVQTS